MNSHFCYRYTPEYDHVTTFTFVQLWDCFHNTCAHFVLRCFLVFCQVDTFNNNYVTDFHMTVMFWQQWRFSFFGIFCFFKVLICQLLFCQLLFCQLLFFQLLFSQLCFCQLYFVISRFGVKDAFKSAVACLLSQNFLKSKHLTDSAHPLQTAIISTQLFPNCCPTVLGSLLNTWHYTWYLLYCNGGLCSKIQCWVHF